MAPPRCGAAPTAAAVVPCYCHGTVLLLWPLGVDRRAPVSNHDAELQQLQLHHQHCLPFCCFQAVVTTVTTCELFLFSLISLSSSPGPRPCSVMWLSVLAVRCSSVLLWGR